MVVFLVAIAAIASYLTILPSYCIFDLLLSRKKCLSRESSAEFNDKQLKTNHK